MKLGEHWKNTTKYIWLNYIWQILKVLNKNVLQIDDSDSNT